MGRGTEQQESAKSIVGLRFAIHDSRCVLRSPRSVTMSLDDRKRGDFDNARMEETAARTHGDLLPRIVRGGVQSPGGNAIDLLSLRGQTAFARSSPNL